MVDEDKLKELEEQLETGPNSSQYTGASELDESTCTA